MIIEHWTRYGGYEKFFTDEDVKNIIITYEDMWDFVRISDQNGNKIYETKGLMRFLGENKYYKTGS